MKRINEIVGVSGNLIKWLQLRKSKMYKMQQIIVIVLIKSKSTASYHVNVVRSKLFEL